MEMSKGTIREWSWNKKQVDKIMNVFHNSSF